MKTIIRAIPVFFASIILTTQSISAMAATNFYGQSCSMIAREIHDLIQDNYNSPCVGDFDIVSAYVESADTSLNHGKVERALKSLDNATRELSEIINARTYCETLSKEAKHILAAIIRARGDIEAMEKMRAMNSMAS